MAISSTYQISLGISDCCTSIEVRGGGRAKEMQSQIFTTYSMEPNTLNGHRHYTSQDGLRAIAFNTDHNEWKIQPAELRQMIKRN